jgi:type I restriction enzyme R subunit
MERADKLLDDFKHEDMPRVAISVDMLDTGIDVPAIQNLVFAKPVFSQVKFWQMIGRGTRLWTNPQTGQEKRDFLILDFWDNFAYFQMNPEGEISSAATPLPVRLFRLRLEKLLLLRRSENAQAVEAAIVQLQCMLAQVPKENINVRPHLSELAELQGRAEWNVLSPERLQHLNQAIAPLLRFVPNVSLPVMTFETLTEHLALAYLKGDTQTIEQLRSRTEQDLAALPIDLPEVAEHTEYITWVNSDSFWDHVDYARIMEMQIQIAPLMQYRRRRSQQIIHLNLPDKIVRRLWIAYGPTGEGAFVQSYRQQVEAYIRDLAKQHPALHKLQQGMPLNAADMDILANVLNRPDLFITEDTLRQTYEQPDATLVDFLRHILGQSELPSREDTIKRAFDEFISEHSNFRTSQLQFLRLVRTAVLYRARLTTKDLTLPPFTRAGQANRLFTPQELDEILELANLFAITTT